MCGWMNLKKQSAKQKKPDTKGHVLCGPIYMKHSVQVNPQRQKTGQQLPEAREGGSLLQGNENVFKVDVLDTQHVEGTKCYFLIVHFFPEVHLCWNMYQFLIPFYG